MYGTIADWRVWATARGDSAPTDAEDGDATAALVRASDYVRSRYVANLRSSYDTTLQPTGFEYPLVEEAAFIAAGLELATPGFFSKTYTPAQQKVMTAAGPIRWTTVGAGKKTYGAMPVHTQIDALFEPYVQDRDAPGVMFASI